MPRLKERPDDGKKPETKKDKFAIDYSKYSINELLDERNYFKSQGLYTEEIDIALKKKFYK
jgi:hypothetical protein